MGAPLLPSERVAIVSVLDPDVHLAFAWGTDWVDAGQWLTMLAILSVGTIGSGGTVGFKFQQATDAAGTGTKDIANKGTSGLVQGSGDDKQAIINLRSDELDVLNKFRWVRLLVTIADTTSSAATALIIGLDPRYGSASSGNLASVDEIV